MVESSLPVTEQSNDLSSQVDLLSPAEFVRIVRQIDSQLFTGWKHHPGLMDSSTLHTLELAAQKIVEVLRNPTTGVVILSGCGTSGRIAFLTARTINRLLEKRGLAPCVRYTISGGDRALICSDELPEDDPLGGQSDLLPFVKDKLKVVYIGISCGISAPYVAGQIDYCMRQPPSIYTTIIMGFNPLSYVRNVPIELWQGRSFYDVVSEFTQLQQQQQQMDNSATNTTNTASSSSSSSYLVLNPVVGPELITGSSRMKGGSMTKMLLDLMFSTAFQHAFSSSDVLTAPTSTSNSTIHEKITHYIETWQSVHQHNNQDSLAAIITQAGDCLSQNNNKGRLFYVGDELMGVIALIDASEMPDTFGQPYTRIRAFVRGGWQAVNAQTGDLEETFGLKKPLFRISLDHFSQEIVPTLCHSDMVVVCTKEPPSFRSLPTDLQRCWVEAKTKGAHVALISVHCNKNSSSSNSSFVSQKAEGEEEGKNRKKSYAKVSDTKKKKEEEEEGKEVIAKVEVNLARLSLLTTAEVEDYALSTLAMKWLLNAVTTGANVRAGLVVGNDMVNVTVANDKIYRRAVRIVAKHSSTSLEVAEEAILRVIYQTDHAKEYLTLPVSQHCIRATQLYETRIVPQAIVLASAACSLQEAADTLSKQNNVRLALNGLRVHKRPKRDDSPASPFVSRI